jgi:hypothetical protein
MTTTDISPSNRPTARFAFNPVSLFVDQTRAARFWFIMFLVMTAAQVVLKVFPKTGGPEKVIIIDGTGTVIATTLLDFATAKSLHIQQAKLATKSFLDRGPADFDLPETLRLMFLRDAYDQARAQFTSEGEERTSKRTEQRASIGQIDIERTSDREVTAYITGQLIRYGQFQGQPFSRYVPFQLWLRLIRNSDISQNGRFPTAVAEFRYEATP